MAMLACHLLNPTTILSTLHLHKQRNHLSESRSHQTVFLVGISKHGSRMRDTWKKIKRSPHLMKLNKITNILAQVLGPSWKTSLAGYAQLSVVTAYQAYETLCASHQSFNYKFVIVSVGLAVGLRFAKDEGVKLPVTITVESKGGQHVPGIEVKPVAATV
jgi:hypothetical protein